MKKLISSFAILLSLNVLISVEVHAEVFRWTDANGKVHFGDKKPDTSAENITEKVKQTNVDTSTSEHQKLETIFRKENAADREYQQQQQKPNPELLKRCAEAKDYLNKISGRVQFLDEKGQPKHVSEAERKQAAEEIQKIIKENCPN
jgi:hypothetical protein